MKRKIAAELEEILQKDGRIFFTEGKKGDDVKIKGLAF